VILYFSLLASALTLKTPLPAYLPPAAEARMTLVCKLRQLEVVKRRIVRGGSEGLLYLGYALTMKVRRCPASNQREKRMGSLIGVASRSQDVIAQLDLLGRTFQQLFGIIGPSSDFSELTKLPTNQESSSRRRREEHRRI
jgi:hypothetical protein